MGVLPADSHVHSEWSWDAGSDPASVGTMRRTCRRAARIGLPAVVFTEHLDLEDDWRAVPGDLGGGTAERYVDAGRVRVPPFDVDGYLRAIESCRREFPELRILTGVEFGEPHLWESKVSALLSSNVLDRINGSLHILPNARGGRSEPATLYRVEEPDVVMRSYLEEIPRRVAGSGAFEVFTHIDYAVRTWPSVTAGPFDPGDSRTGSAMRCGRLLAPGERWSSTRDAFGRGSRSGGLRRMVGR